MFMQFWISVKLLFTFVNSMALLVRYRNSHIEEDMEEFETSGYARRICLEDALSPPFPFILRVQK
jgi:hypothetical protein